MTYLRNMTKRRRMLQRVSIKGMVFLFDPKTKELYDGPAFEDNHRLLRVGFLSTPTQIQWEIP